MTDQNTAPVRQGRAERLLEAGLYGSRWLLAPFYLGLIAALVMLLIVFARELAHELPLALTMSPDQGILAVLSLIDLSLAANLLLIVIFSGYENFVSKLEVASHEDRPAWMGSVDFSGLKLKLVASIVAISAIHLLKAFMNLGNGQPVPIEQLRWLVIIHLTFVGSGVLLALMDWLTARSKGAKLP